MQEFLSVMSDMVTESGEVWQVYGEFFGPGIQKGVYYGDEKDFRIFDIMVDGVLFPPHLAQGFVKDLPVDYVPVVGYIVGLENTLQFNSEFNSTLADKEDNLCEGVVIRPEQHNYYNRLGSIFIIKKKNETFRVID